MLCPSPKLEMTCGVKKNITVPVPVFTIKKCSLQKQLFCTCAIRSYRIAERKSYIFCICSI